MSKLETIEDIVQELRENANSLDKFHSGGFYSGTIDGKVRELIDLSNRIEAAHNAELAAFRRSKHSGTHVEYAVGRDGPYGIVVEGPTYATKVSALVNVGDVGFVVSRRVGKWVKVAEND